VLAVAGATLLSGCAGTEWLFGSTDLDTPGGRCVTVEEHGRAPATPVEPLRTVEMRDATAPPAVVGPQLLGALAWGADDREGAEAYVLAWVVHALDARELGDLEPLLRGHGPQLPSDQVAALVRGHCDAWISAGERQVDLDEPLMLRSVEDGATVQVEVAGTVTWHMHLHPVQHLSMRIDVERRDGRWQLVAVQGPMLTPRGSLSL